MVFLAQYYLVQIAMQNNACIQLTSGGHNKQTTTIEHWGVMEAHNTLGGQCGWSPHARTQHSHKNLWHLLIDLPVVWADGARICGWGHVNQSPVAGVIRGRETNARGERCWCDKCWYVGMGCCKLILPVFFWGTEEVEGSKAIGVGIGGVVGPKW